MNYREQRRFVRNSRWSGAAAALLVVGAGTVCLLLIWPMAKWELTALTGTMIALAVSSYYTPDYLHLTVKEDKSWRWAIKIRWRVTAALLLFAMLFARSLLAVMVIASALLVLVVSAMAAKKAPLRYFSLYFWLCDVMLIGALLLGGAISLLVASVLLTTSAHFSVVICKARFWRWSGIVAISGCTLVAIAAALSGTFVSQLLSGIALFLISATGTAWLCSRAAAHNQKNIQEALEELVAFTGYSPGRVWQLWGESDLELAKNWQAAGISEDDHQRLKDWYRQNSGLYVFAISAHNLEYKKLRSNLRMLDFARGACLDYGAGNGELILELAERGHAATYFDVDGESMRFARWRAQRNHLDVRFFHSKEELREAGLRFDTIFSFDVLEHLPDLRAELAFLSSLLRPKGLLVCDVPAGATKNHPMHLDHHLDVAAHLKEQGLLERRGLFARMVLYPDKYIFQARQIG